MVKHVYGWEFSNQLEKKHKVHVRSFSSAKVKCMKDYIKPCIREEQPDHVILHVGTNNLSSEQNAERSGLCPGFESRCSYLIFRYGACFEQGVP